jgi:hypothetical protein
VTSSWFFLSTLNYDARSTTHQILSQVWDTVVRTDVNDYVVRIKVWLMKWERQTDKTQYLVLVKHIVYYKKLNVIRLKIRES